MTGDGITFMRYVKQIVARYPKHDEGVPHIYDGAFKLGAWWWWWWWWWWWPALCVCDESPSFPKTAFSA